MRLSHTLLLILYLVLFLPASAHAQLHFTFDTCGSHIGLLGDLDRTGRITAQGTKEAYNGIRRFRRSRLNHENDEPLYPGRGIYSSALHSSPKQLGQLGNNLRAAEQEYENNSSEDTVIAGTTFRGPNEINAYLKKEAEILAPLQAAHQLHWDYTLPRLKRIVPAFGGFNLALSLLGKAPLSVGSLGTVALGTIGLTTLAMTQHTAGLMIELQPGHKRQQARILNLLSLPEEGAWEVTTHSQLLLKPYYRYWETGALLPIEVLNQMEYLSAREHHPSRETALPITLTRVLWHENDRRGQPAPRLDLLMTLEKPQSHRPALAQNPEAKPFLQTDLGFIAP